MTYDRNPKFGADAGFQATARKVGDMLWEATRGDVSAIPSSYLENLRHEYAEGKVSMLELMDRVDLGSNATYEDYCEVFDKLLQVEGSQWPDPKSVLYVDPARIATNRNVDFSEFDDFEFAETGDLSDKIEKFLQKVIASVYLDGVSSVTDAEGNPPNENNNYLLSEDGSEFSGVFYDNSDSSNPKQFPFQIQETASNKWSIKY
jgi:hypothetical protein